MGRRTFEAIGKPLPGRENIVVTRDAGWRADGVHVAPDLSGAVALARRLAAQAGVDEVMIIGGAEIYRLLLPEAERVYLTIVHAHPEGDAYFTPLDPAVWHEVSRAPIPPDPRDQHACTLTVWERRAQG